MKRYDEAVEIVAQQIRNIDVAELMKQNKIHVGKDDTIDYLLAQASFKVLVDKYARSESGRKFLQESLAAEIEELNEEATHAQ